MAKAVQENIKIPPIAYDYKKAEELTIKKDIPYCEVNDKKLSFDIYYPKNFVLISIKGYIICQ